jgi:hypothetical protein
MRQIKEPVTDELLPRAFSISRDTRVWTDPAMDRDRFWDGNFLKPRSGAHAHLDESLRHTTI